MSENNRQNPVPCKKAVVQGEKYRFTVLTPALIRMEYSAQGEFVDRRTQTVVNREFPEPSFGVKETGEMLEIVTSALRLRYRKGEFSPAGLQVRVNGQFGAWSSVWNYQDVQKDLGGTARTLDGADGEIVLEGGVLSTQGWTVLDDSKSLLLDENGWVAKRKDPEGKDLYFFGYGREYIKCLQDFHALTGEVPLLPRFALGNWWSRYYRYTQNSYLALMERFREENIPFTVAVLDMDWHVTKVDPKYGTGWTGYTWNRELFPDPQGFLRMLHERGMKVTLNVHPADGVRAFEECYPDFAAYMGMDPQEGEPVSFEIGNPQFVKGYFSCVHHPLEEQGVDFWWIDWQQGANCGVEGLDPLWMLNHYHYLDSCKNGNRGLIFSRYCGPGSHRYPVGFSGDTIISWKSLQFQPYFTATASNIGYGWWSHDIGGHMQGIKDDELALRWLQFGCFSPILRLHSSNSEFNGKEPWRYNRIVEEIMKRFLRLRHRLIPYLYTMNVRANTESIPLMQPLYYHNPYCREAYEVPNEYYFGSQLLVCPITKPADKESGMAEVTAWIPEGRWIDLFTGLVYEGNRMLTLYRTAQSIPVLAKCGAIIPLDAQGEGNSLANPGYLEVDICAGDDGSFWLWEDDGQGTLFQEKDWAKTQLRYEAGEVSRFIREIPQGNTAVIPARRKYRLRVWGTGEGMTAKAYADGRELSGIGFAYDAEKGVTTIEVPGVPNEDRLVVEMAHTVPHQNQKVRRVFDFLNRAEMSFDLKTAIYRVAGQVEEGQSLLYVASQLREMGLRRQVEGPVLEILTACE